MSDDDATLTWRAVLGSDGEPVVEPTAPARLDAPPALPERYLDLGFLAEGGVGEVRRVRDLKLDAELVMKLQRRRARGPLRARFQREARLTARLHHPNIVPALDLGVLDDGTPWFTMPEVRGETLREVVDAYGRATGADRSTRLRRVIELIAEVARALAYAHEQGVVHRDVKPQNLMVGRFGEVRVMDFGVALDLRAPDPELDDAVVGTPLYMAPEQARGDTASCGAPIDTYALGVVLYELLTGAAPYAGSGIAVWHQIIEGPPPDPMDHPGAVDAPAELVALVRACIARSPQARPAAVDLSMGLVGWLDGEGRRERARAIVLQADPLADLLGHTREQAEASRQGARELLDPLPGWAAPEQKERGFLLEDDAERQQLDVMRLEARYVQQLQAALYQDPDCPEAHARLADHHRSKLAEAERAHAPAAEAEHEEGLRAHDRGAHAAFLRGRSAVTLHTDPDGAQVVAHRLTHRGRRWQEAESVPLGRTPLNEVELPFGNWKLTIHAEGRPVVTYPVRLKRGEHWNGVRPGSRSTHVIALPESLALDECYVPAGWFTPGGDAEATDPLPARPIWVDAFVIRRDQVTFGQYLAFLNALGQAAAPWVPWRDTSGDQRALRWAHDGWRADTARSPDEPVVLLLPAYAAAFAAWRSEQDCKTWRLPHEIEWERAARGADQRHYPWGMGFDPCFSNVFSSVEGPPRAVAVGSFPVDTSPYGVRDLGGNTRDHCANGYADVPQGNILDPRAPPDPVLQIGRGGAWLSRASNARCAGRFVQAEKPTGAVSFRLARSLFEPGQIGV